MKTLFTFFLFAALTIAAQAQSTWTIDKPHSNIEFVATHMVIAEVEGRFNEFDATINQQNDGWDGTEVTFTANVGSIDTGNDKRDGHLKSDDFFNAEKYPELSFSGKMKKKGDGYVLDGELTIRDVTKPIELDVQKLGVIQTDKGRKAGFKVSGEINRFEYNLRWDNQIADGSYVVGKEITIKCNVELNEVVM